jgi:hypothetical protein
MKSTSISTFLLFSFYTFCELGAQDGNWQVVKTLNSVSDCSECGMAAVNGQLSRHGFLWVAVVAI